MTEIIHSGTITAIKQNIITVEITQKEACNSCALREACSQTTKQHQIEAETQKSLGGFGGGIPGLF